MNSTVYSIGNIVGYNDTIDSNIHNYVHYYVNDSIADTIGNSIHDNKKWIFFSTFDHVYYYHDKDKEFSFGYPFGTFYCDLDNSNSYNADTNATANDNIDNSTIFCVNKIAVNNMVSNTLTLLILAMQILCSIYFYQRIYFHAYMCESIFFTKLITPTILLLLKNI